MKNSERRDLIELWLLAGEGTADAAQLARLDSWIESDADARAYVLDIARQQGWLAWNAADLQLATAFGEMVPASDGALASLAPRPPEAPRRTAQRRLSADAALRWAWVALAASVLGFLAGQQTTPTPRQAAVESVSQPAMFRATMVSSTGCIWGPGNTLGSPSQGLAGGDALQLLEGIAEFQIGLEAGDVRLQLEGPASIVLTAQGAASVNYGKIIIKTGELHDIYSIETPFGRVLADRQSEIGLICFGSTAEMHSFRGGATVESPWLSPSDRDASVAIRANQALVFKDVGDGALEAAHGPAQRWRFTLQVPMTNDFLAVGPDYVREILDSRPVAYWRFEGETDGVVRNEADDRFHGRLKGKVRWVGPVGNQAIEFGVTPEPGSLVVAESWDEVLDGDFAMEAWIKPSHYHLGSIIGFIGEFDWKDRRNKHGVLLEVHGASQPSNIHQPERIRFLYRPTLGVQGGVSSYSDQVYQPRRWQHVAAVREGKQLRLYLNGDLVQQAEDPSPLPPGLQLVMGQLYTETVERFFIGHVDEVAIYDRPLTKAEIGRRLELLDRPQNDGPVF